MLTNDSLLKKLTRLQKKHRLSDQVFANRLKIARSSWTLTRLGNQGVGISLLAGVATAFPEMEQDILAFLRGRNGH